jgi:hypothetical protein
MHTGLKCGRYRLDQTHGRYGYVIKILVIYGKEMG